MNTSMVRRGRRMAGGRRSGIRPVMRLWDMGLGRIFTPHRGLYFRVRPRPLYNPLSLCGDFKVALMRVIRIENDEPGIMSPGHVFTIEPVVLQGTKTGVWTCPDGWTLSTDNGNLGAMFGHTSLVTEPG